MAGAGWGMGWGLAPMRRDRKHGIVGYAAESSAPPGRGELGRVLEQRRTQ